MNNSDLMLEINRIAAMENLQKENRYLKEKLEKIKQIVSDYGLTNVNLLSDDLTDFEKDILREILELD